MWYNISSIPLIFLAFFLPFPLTISISFDWVLILEFFFIWNVGNNQSLRVREKNFNKLIKNLYNCIISIVNSSNLFAIGTNINQQLNKLRIIFNCQSMLILFKFLLSFFFVELRNISQTKIIIYRFKIFSDCILNSNRKSEKDSLQGGDLWWDQFDFKNFLVPISDL